MECVTEHVQFKIADTFLEQTQFKVREQFKKLKMKDKNISVMLRVCHKDGMPLGMLSLLQKGLGNTLKVFP
jgi:hypothetical protein